MVTSDAVRSKAVVLLLLLIHCLLLLPSFVAVCLVRVLFCLSRFTIISLGKRAGADVINFFMLNSAEHDIYPAHSMINTTSERLKTRNVLFVV